MEVENNKISKVSRRDFLKTSAAVSVAAMTVGSHSVYAAGNEELKVALIGCGGRGKGALKDYHNAAKMIGPSVKVIAIADVQKDRAEAVAKQYNVPTEHVFTTFDGYKKVLATDAEYVLIATSPNFRPVHFEAAVRANKHVFMEKPVAVDPPGIRRIIAAGEIAKRKGLGVVAGTQRRHQKPYRETAAAIQQGAIGRILSARVWWCTGQLWYKTKDPGESDASYMVRNWVSFTEMSGDHIVEQHVHNLDVANWFIGRTPTQALGFGGRARRKTGNQFDFFSIDYDYGDGVTVHSMCRQINGSYRRNSEFFTGTNGTSWGTGNMEQINKKSVTIPEFTDGNPKVIEHFDMINSIRDGRPLNESRNVAEATMTAIMGRISAYTGQIIRWSDLMTNAKSPYYSLTLRPSAEDFEKGRITAPPDDVVAVPGEEKEQEKKRRKRKK